MNSLLNPENVAFYKKGTVFLGGTCNNDTWRAKLIPMLHSFNYFNPVVKDYNDEALARENQAKKDATHMLYVITPNMKSFYSIAEMTEDAVNGVKPVIICFLNNTNVGDKLFTLSDMRTFQLVTDLLSKYRTVTFCSSLEDIANLLNNI